MYKKSIFFGFYKGLGDFISDSYIIEHFYKNDYKVYISIASWLENLAKFIFPKANIISYKTGKDLLNIDYNSKYIFLSPNYLHPININYKSLILYFIKYKAVRKNLPKDTIIIKPSNWELINYYLNLKKTYLNKHFYYMSYELIKKYFPDVPDTYKECNQKIDNINKKPINKIFIFPFSGFKPKDYPLENYYKIANFIKEKYKITPTFFVVPSDKEKLKEFENQFNVESKSLVELTKIFNKNTLVICSDSGPGHLAARFGANLIVLYSTTNPEKYKPIGSGKILTIKEKKAKDISYKKIIEIIENNFVLG